MALSILFDARKHANLFFFSLNKVGRIEVQINHLK